MTKNAILTLQPPATELSAWVNDVAGGSSLTPLVGDASARFYFRVQTGPKYYIAMRSPLSEKPKQFLATRDFLAAGKIKVPALIAADIKRGFILLEDFGDETYFISASHNKPQPLYKAALDSLIKIQQLSPPAGLLPDYNHVLLRREMMLYPKWYCHYYQQPLSKREITLFNQSIKLIIRHCHSQLFVVTHRDYHSRNLMNIGALSPGIIDFQDAVMGPAAYDVVSLLRDAYIEWSREQQLLWLRYYYQTAINAGISLPADEQAWRHSFNIISIQRGLKVLGIFARLYYRDGKKNYLNDIPLVYKHLLAACRDAPEFVALADLIEQRPPTLCK